MTTTRTRRIAAGLAAAGAALTTLGLAAPAGAADPTSALVTPYVNAPGHQASLSAVCHGTDQVRIGSHPWDESHRNFQIWQDGRMLVNTTTGAAQYWDEPVGDYTIRYAGEAYEVDGDLCDQPPATTSTTAPPTTTTEAPPETTTTTEAPPETTTTTEAPPETTTTSTRPEPTIPPGTDETLPPPTSTTFATTPAPTTEPPAVDLTAGYAGKVLPATGQDELPLVVAGLGLMLTGGGLVARFGKR